MTDTLKAIKEKNDNTIAFHIKLSRYNLSEIDETYTDISIIYSDKVTKTERHTSTKSILHETDLFEQLRDDLWYIDKPVMDKIIEYAIKEIELEMSSESWIYADFLDIQIDINDIKKEIEIEQNKK